MTGGVLPALRLATRPAHDRLERDLDVLDRCRTPERYLALLVGFRSVYAPLEQALDASPLTRAAVPDWELRRKTGWLEADLRALGAAVAPLPAGGPPATPAEVVGTLYVMEGATLGGALVVRSMTAGGAAALPHRFFASYGDRRGAMWAAFRRAVEGLALQQGDVGAAVDAALRTFAAVQHACVPAATRRSA